MGPPFVENQRTGLYNIYRGVRNIYQRPTPLFLTHWGGGFSIDHALLSQARYLSIIQAEVVPQNLISMLS